MRLHRGRTRDEVVELALTPSESEPEDRHGDLARTRREPHAGDDLHRPQEQPRAILGRHPVGHERLAAEPAAYAPASLVVDHRAEDRERAASCGRSRGASGRRPGTPPRACSGGG